MIWKVTLNGTLADFDEAAQAAAKAALVVSFNQPSITAEHITLTVEAGSIIVTGEVRLEDPSVTFSEMSTTVVDLFNNATAMTATFGLPLISIDTAPTLNYASKPPAAPPPPSPPSPTPPALPPSEEGSGDSSGDDDMLPYIIGGAAGGGCLVLALCVSVAVLCARKRDKQAVQPLADADANANAPAAARPSRGGLPSSLRPKSKKVATPPPAGAAQTIYTQNAADPAAGLNQAEFAAAAAQLPGPRQEESETARCLATMAAASGGAGATPFSAQVEAPLAPLAPLQGPAGGAGAGGGGLRPLAPPLTPLGGAAGGGAPGLRPLAPLGAVGGARGGGGGPAPLRPLGS